MDKSKWEYKKLGEVATFERGLTYSKKDESDSSTKGVLRSNNIDLDSHQLVFDEIKWLNETFEIPQSKKLAKDSIFICMSNGSKTHLGKVAFIDKDYDYAFGGFMGMIKPLNIYPKYLFYYFLSKEYRDGLEQIGKGANINNLRFAQLANFMIPNPITEVQQRIVAELDCLNEMIALKQEQLKEFDKLAQSIFYDMFGNPITNEKGWDKVFMKQIIKVVGGYAFKSDLFKDNGIPILRIGNINTGEFRPINMVYWIEDDKLSRYVMHPGDLVLSLTGTVGKDDYGNVCILDNSYDRYYLNQRNAKLEIIGNVEKLYLSRLLKIDEVKAKLTGTSRGVRQANISNKDIENLIIPLPPLALQQQFAEKIQAIEAQKELVKQSIAETQHLLDSRMDYYFD